MRKSVLIAGMGVARVLSAISVVMNAIFSVSALSRLVLPVAALAAFLPQR